MTTSPQLIAIFIEAISDLIRIIEALRAELLALAQTQRDSEGRTDEYIKFISSKIERIEDKITEQDTRSQVQDASHTEQLASLSRSLSSTNRQIDAQTAAIVNFKDDLEAIQAALEKTSRDLLVFRHPVTFLSTLNWQDRALVTVFLAVVFTAAIAIVFLVG